MGELFRAKRPCAGLGGDAAHFRLVAMGGFALHEAFLRRVAGVSDPRVVQFPRLAAMGPFTVCDYRPPCSAIPPDWRRRGRGLRWCSAQIADHLGEKH